MVKNEDSIKNEATKPLSELEKIHKSITDTLSALCGERGDIRATIITDMSKKLYEELFSWRDNAPVRKLSAPSRYHLIELFEELKFSRPGADQKYLNKLIKGISHGKM